LLQVSLLTCYTRHGNGKLLMGVGIERAVVLTQMTVISFLKFTQISLALHSRWKRLKMV